MVWVVELGRNMYVQHIRIRVILFRHCEPLVLVQIFKKVNNLVWSQRAPES